MLGGGLVGFGQGAGARLVVLTTASDPAHFSRRIITTSAYDDPLWRVHEVPGPASSIDPKRLAGREEDAFPESLYLRLFENEWVASEDRLANEDDLLACVTLDRPLDPGLPGVRYMIGLDIGLKNRSRRAQSSATPRRIPGAEHPRASSSTASGTGRALVFDRSSFRSSRSGSRKQLRRYNRAHVRFDPYQAIHLGRSV